LNVNSENIVELYEAFDRFLIEDGKGVCEKYIRDELPNENLGKILEEPFLCSDLFRACCNQAARNAKYFLKSPHLLGLRKDTLTSLLANDYVALPEIAVFQAVLDWSKEHAGAGDEISDLLKLVRFPIMDYHDLRHHVETSGVVPVDFLLTAYRHLARPKGLPLNEQEKNNPLFSPRRCIEDPPSPCLDVYTFKCPDHGDTCCAVAWDITNFSHIKLQKLVSNPFEIRGRKWRLWAYIAGEAKHADSFSIYLEALRSEKESHDFHRNTTFFFSLLNKVDSQLTRHFPSSQHIIFNFEKSVWGNGLIELKKLHDLSLGYITQDTVSVQLHLLDCLALDG